MIRIRRIYEEEQPGEGYRVFVDRLWPRGLSNDRARWDEWMKDIAPSNEIRKWFSHDPEKWETFRSRYGEELALKQDSLEKLKKLERKHRTITLLYSANNMIYNNAIALREILESQTPG